MRNTRHFIPADREEYTVNVLKFRPFFFLSPNKRWFTSAGIHKIFVRIANSENPDQTAYSEAV